MKHKLDMIYVNLTDRSRGRAEGFLFNNNYTEV